ncbi:sialidase family protein [Croceibacterium sp. TMG7-5b_MA50]|uniref:sialidase family protein n=1 Tax=Croceibacterium sp. TMG7-5b_MA50 TaxID=3121290 RepID=UPI003221AE25
MNDSYVLAPPIPSLDTAAYGTRTFQGLPSIAITGSRIWLAWTGGAGARPGEVPGDYHTFVYSDDGGRTWSREFYQVPVLPVTDRVGDPRLWTAPDGKLWVFFFQSGNGQATDNQMGAWLTIIPDPQAAVPTLQQAGWFADGIPQRPFLYNGEWLLPIDYPFMNPRRPERAGQHVYRIDWNNRRFQWVTTLPRNIPEDFTEPALVQLRDGRVLAHQRMARGLYQRFTTTPGAWQWTAGQPFAGFPTVSTRSALLRSPSGRLAMVTNKSSTQRENMTVAFSADEGATWPYQHTFDTQAGISYPDMVFTADGDLLVVYDFGRFYGKIMLARINEDSIVRGVPEVTLTTVNHAVRR